MVAITSLYSQFYARYGHWIGKASTAWSVYGIAETGLANVLALQTLRMYPGFKDYRGFWWRGVKMNDISGSDKTDWVVPDRKGFPGAVSKRLVRWQRVWDSAKTGDIKDTGLRLLQVGVPLFKIRMVEDEMGPGRFTRKGGLLLPKKDISLWDIGIKGTLSKGWRYRHKTLKRMVRNPGDVALGIAQLAAAFALGASLFGRGPNLKSWPARLFMQAIGYSMW